jgi:hypothetical protein
MIWFQNIELEWVIAGEEDSLKLFIQSLLPLNTNDFPYTHS